LAAFRALAVGGEGGFHVFLHHFLEVSEGEVGVELSFFDRLGEPVATLLFVADRLVAVEQAGASGDHRGRVVERGGFDELLECGGGVPFFRESEVAIEQAAEGEHCGDVAFFRAAGPP